VVQAINVARKLTMVSSVTNMGSRPPAQPTRLLGREAELVAIRGALRPEGARLLTLTGPAGVGKTRLAVEVGHCMSDEFAQGVAFVDLSPIRDPSRVPAALARGVGLQDAESPRLPERLLAYLRERESLVILDNFEQIISAAPWLADLLATCPSITLLVTSREPLRLRWEHTYRVGALALADPGHLPPSEELALVPAVALFVERARALDPGFALCEDNAGVVAELCVRLDGLPLAIELAAARTGSLSPQMILDRLGQRLSLLRWEAPDLPERHHTLRSAIDWSHDLLTDQEQTLLRRLGVFVGGFTLDAARAVVSSNREEVVLDVLSSLVDKSLVQAEGRGTQTLRYRLLESIREYTLEQLEIRDEIEEVRRAHALYFLALAERADPELIGPEQRAWFFRLEQEHDNLSAALRWLSSQDEDALALRLAVALGYFWMRGYYSEGRGFLEDLVGRASDAGTDPRTRALSLNLFGILLLFLGETGRARAVFEEGLAVARSANDPLSVTLSHVCLGVLETWLGNGREGMLLLEDALARSRRVGNAWLTARALHELGICVLNARDYARAERLLEEACDGYNSVGDERTMAEALLWLGMAVGERGDAPRAATLIRQVLGISRGLQDRRLLNICAYTVLWLVGETADPGQVARLMGANEALRQVTGMAADLWWEHAPVAPAIAALGARLDEGSVAAARTEGYALSLEQIDDLLLQVLDEAEEADPRRAARADAGRHSVLSPRESEILRLVAAGLSNQEIAGRLFITERTVRHHLTSVFGKLGADNRTRAVVLAAEQNLL
jgi:predicted ATPase/DNA-binding CsgD family transcriptional regulator